MIIGIIPAKSISKRIANKNFITFNGKPMIAWTIQAAKKTKIFDQIIISTDSEKVISKMSKYNVNCIIRPKKLSEEKYGIDEVMRYSISKIKKKIKYVCCLFPCAPLMKSNDILNGFNKIKTNKYKYVFARGVKVETYGFEISSDRLS